MGQEHAARPEESSRLIAPERINRNPGIPFTTKALLTAAQRASDAGAHDYKEPAVEGMGYPAQRQAMSNPDQMPPTAASGPLPTISPGFNPYLNMAPPLLNPNSPAQDASLLGQSMKGANV